MLKDQGGVPEVNAVGFEILPPFRIIPLEPIHLYSIYERSYITRNRKEHLIKVLEQDIQRKC